MTGDGGAVLSTPGESEASFDPETPLPWTLANGEAGVENDGEEGDSAP